MQIIPDKSQFKALYAIQVSRSRDSSSCRTFHPAPEFFLFLGIFFPMTTKERYKNIIRWFMDNMPVAETELHYEDPFSLLVSVILSAQCTDKRVNMITPALMNRYPTPEAMSEATPDEIFQYIKSCSYPNNKAHHLLGMARKLVSDFNGRVPESVDDLMKLPGVGRKTANVVTLVAFGHPAMPVDTHIFRVSERLGLTTGAKNPADTEKQLLKYLPESALPVAHHWLILHGRYVCIARRPKCEECGLREWCRWFRETRNLKPGT